MAHPVSVLRYPITVIVVRRVSGVDVPRSVGRERNRDTGHRINYDNGDGKPDIGHEKTSDIRCPRAPIESGLRRSRWSRSARSADARGDACDGNQNERCNRGTQANAAFPRVALHRHRLHERSIAPRQPCRRLIQNARAYWSVSGQLIPPRNRRCCAPRRPSISCTFAPST